MAQPQTGEVWARLASGIEAGIVGGSAMLGVLFCASLWDGHVWWETPNLLGSTFYGIRAFRSGPGMATLSGLALHFVITGTLGGLFGLAFGGIQQRGRLVLLGLMASVGWYNLANVTFWPTLNPWVLVASPRPATVVSHVLLGACLGYMGQRYRLGSPAAFEGQTFLAPLHLAHSIDLPRPLDLAPTLDLAPLTETSPEIAPSPGPAHDAGTPVASERGPAPAVAPSDALE